MRIDNILRIKGIDFGVIHCGSKKNSSTLRTSFTKRQQFNVDGGFVIKGIPAGEALGFHKKGNFKTERTSLTMK